MEFPRVIWFGIGSFGPIGLGNLGDFTTSAQAAYDQVAEHHNEYWRVYAINTVTMECIDVTDLIREHLPYDHPARGVI